MKSFASIVSLVFAFFVGRWTVSPAEVTNWVEKVKTIESTRVIEKDCQLSDTSKERNGEPKKCSMKDLVDSRKFLRTESKKKDRLIQKLAVELAKAQQNGDLAAENRFFQEMLELNPFHKLVFQTKVIYLQNDGDWEGAKDILKQCAEVHPNYLYCQRRLANIRSSTVDDKIKHGKECLRLKKDDTLCMMDLAIAYKMDGRFEEAKKLIEEALNLPKQTMSFDRRYVLYIYGMVLEELFLYAEAEGALEESCELNMKAACQLLKKSSERAKTS